MSILRNQGSVLFGLTLASMLLNVHVAAADQSVPANVQTATALNQTIAAADPASSVTTPVQSKPCQKLIAQNLTPADSVTATAVDAATCPDRESAPVAALLSELAMIQPAVAANTTSLAPSLTIANPSGFGADRNTVFLTGDFQDRTRYTKSNHAEVGLGVGLGDAKAVGLELSYDQSQSGGGFSAKLHHRLSDNASLALGWNDFATTGKTTYADYPKNSYYAAYSQILNNRLAVTAGLGGGQFLTESKANVANPQGVNVFGSVALKVAQPVTFITEWTGQDLALGLSIKPFKNIPLVITPAFRDITGAGDGGRFVLGTGFSVKF